MTACASSRFIRAAPTPRRSPARARRPRPGRSWRGSIIRIRPSRTSFALEDLEGGATGAGAGQLRAAIGAYGYGADLSAAGLERILDGVFLDGIAIEFDITPQAKDAPAHLAALLKKQGIAPDKADIRFGYDPLGIMAAAGDTRLSRGRRSRRSLDR